MITEHASPPCTFQTKLEKERAIENILCKMNRHCYMYSRGKPSEFCICFIFLFCMSQLLRLIIQQLMLIHPSLKLFFVRRLKSWQHRLDELLNFALPPSTFHRYSEPTHKVHDQCGIMLLAPVATQVSERTLIIRYLSLDSTCWNLPRVLDPKQHERQVKRALEIIFAIWGRKWYQTGSKFSGVLLLWSLVRKNPCGTQHTFGCNAYILECLVTPDHICTEHE